MRCVALRAPKKEKRQVKMIRKDDASGLVVRQVVEFFENQMAFVAFAQ